MKKVYYVGIVTEENGAYGVHFPDLPGCVSAGDSLEEALDGAHEALALHVEGMQEDGEELPKASSPVAVRAEASDYLTLAPVPVVVEHGAAKRINITLNEGLIERIDRAAKAEGTNRSAYIASAARYRLSHPQA